MAGKNNRSLVEDKDLRFNVAWAVCQKINELIKEKMPDASESDYYTEAEVREWVNNPTSVEAYLGAQGKNTNNIYNAIKEQYTCDPLFRGKGGECRFGHLMLKEGNSPLDKENNQRVVNYMGNGDCVKSLAYDFIDILDQTDPSVFTPTTHEELANMAGKYTKTHVMGFVACDTGNVLAHDDFALKERIGGMAGLLQSGPLNVYYDISESPYSLLIPPKENSAVFDAILAEERTIRDSIYAVSPDLKEFDALADGELGFKPSKTTFGNYACYRLAESRTLSENVETRKLIDAGLLTKGFIYEYTFKDAAGNVVPVGEVAKNFKDGKLLGGIQKVDLTPEEKEQMLTARKTVQNKAKLFDLGVFGKEVAENKIPLVHNSLHTDMKSFMQKYDAFVTAHSNDFTKFAEENKALIERIDKGRLDIALAKDATAEKIGVENAYYVGEHARLKSQNYAGLAQRATTIKENTRGTRYAPSLREIVETVFSYNDEVKDVKKGFGKALTAKEIRESLATIHEIGIKDKEYNNRGFFGRWWYGNSHNQMMHARESLINNLTELGMDRDMLVSLGSSENDLSKLSIIGNNLTVAGQEIAEKATQKADALLDRLIIKPKERINGLKEREEEVHAEMSTAIQAETALKLKYHEEFHPNYQAYVDSFDFIEKMKVEEEYQEWLDGKPDYKQNLKKYADIADEKIKEYDAIGKEIKDRERELDYGKEYTEAKPSPEKENEELENQLKNALGQNSMQLQAKEFAKEVSSLSKSTVAESEKQK